MGAPRHKLVERYLYAFDWDVEAIWKLTLPVESRGMSDLDWILVVPVWGGENGPYTVAPMDVLAAPDQHAEEFARMMAADTSFPIDITYHLDRWVILDGVHRLLKLRRDDARTVRVRAVPGNSLSHISK